MTVGPHHHSSLDPQLKFITPSTTIMLFTTTSFDLMRMDLAVSSRFDQENRAVVDDAPPKHTTASKSSSNFKSKRRSNAVSAAALREVLPYYAKFPKHLPAHVSTNKNRTNAAKAPPTTNSRRAAAPPGTSLNGGGGKGISGGDGPGQGGAGDGDSDDDEDDSKDSSKADSQVVLNPINSPATYTYRSSGTINTRTSTPTTQNSTGWVRRQ